MIANQSTPVTLSPSIHPQSSHLSLPPSLLLPPPLPPFQPFKLIDRELHFYDGGVSIARLDLSLFDLAHSTTTPSHSATFHTCNPSSPTPSRDPAGSPQEKSSALTELQNVSDEVYADLYENLQVLFF